VHKTCSPMIGRNMCHTPRSRETVEF
jgi:hypothetical protein